MPKYVNSAGLTKALSLVKTELAKKAGTSAATQSANGLMSAADKKKLDGITAGANAYTHPTSSGNKHIPSGGSSGQILRWSADGTAVWGAEKDTTYSAMKGATASAAGSSGLVPAPAAGNQAQYLRGDGTWATPTNTTYNAATTSAAGLMSAADKTKLDGIASGANAYSHPTTSGNKHIPSGGSSGQILRWASDGTATWGADNNTTYNPMTGATSSAAGSAGLVPAPAAGKQASFLRGDGTWVVPTNTTYDPATQSAQGLMSAADKKKLDGIASGATAVTVDSGLSSTSTNPVQNKVINSALAAKAGTAVATQSAAGLMSSTDKAKLDGIASGANAYSHPTSSGNKHIPSGGSSGQILRWSADGTAVWGADNNTTYNAATQSAQGLMSAADKTKLDGIATGANKITVDSALSSSSTNPVQNKVINTALAGKAAKKTGTFYIEGTGSTAGTWLGSHSDITEYYAGLMVAYKVGIAGASSTTLNINSLGAVKVVRNTTTAVTTHYGVGSVLFLVYTVDSSGTAYWKVSDYDSDTKTRSSNKADTKMFIIGATAQSTSGQTTYSNANCYIGADNHLYSNGAKVLNATDYPIGVATTAEIDAAIAAL